MSKKKILLLCVMLIAVLFMATGCVPRVGGEMLENPAGFFMGIWHGLIVWITFLMGLFTGGEFTIYEAYNTGWLYNLGFLIGIGSSVGGTSVGIFRCKRRIEINI